jgi:MinD-like ATPase involved in chromosome partitioning or flagellar assembly
MRFLDLIATLRLDALLVDAHPGLNEETLPSMAIFDVLVIVLRPD